MKAMTVSDEALAEKELPQRADPKIVILMYHNLVFGRTGNEYNRDIYNFEHDLAFMRQRFKIIDFNDLIAVSEGKMKLTTDAAIISFDDGDLSIYGLAYPLLREYGIKATFFIIAGFVGETGYMNWAQIRELATYRDPMIGSLFTIGSHGMDHAYMGELSPDRISEELVDSKSQIEKNTGVSVSILALPFGSGTGSSLIGDLAIKAGYKAIRTSDNMYATPSTINLLRLPGMYIDNSSTDKVTQKIWTMLGR